ncbi:glutamate racemase [Lactobacillus crispatus]|uniref:Glutamate racemase n=1 Tax=Lactobacillus crispatus TaxID=47770 RepID=A0AB73BT63_9LACO|nr:glutamate racemase [Lactobacillus crispatus]KAA8797986.1 glutamate racemase [Lactobacillus crispatus]KAA8799569.1 glutamate racemase [Lactobacillus crispatus]KAA8803951.1 glutamate racemase [Lactobacillus crispatus]KAA8806421.1 glutamate racemase [Lactobacillus crispatus]
MDNRPIGLLDSGLGGLSVAKKVIEKLPNESTVFIGDNAHMPYGDRTKEEVIELTRKSVKFLLSQNVKLIIFACNTATAAAMSTIQEEIDPQIIGVIQSGSLAAARTTKNKKVAVVATNVTVNSHAYAKEIHFRDPEIQVTELAAPKLAPLVEAQKDHATNLAVVKESLAPLEGKDFDALIMGCTHYPLIQTEFEEAVDNKKVTILDPADQVAQYTFNVMRRDGLFSDENQPAVHEYYTTGDPTSFDRLARTFMDDDTLTSKHVDTENE